MARKKRSEKIVGEIAARFVSATSEHLGKSASELSRDLGYANPTTLHAVKNGKAIPDFVRMAGHTAALQDVRGRSLNFHWVITGHGAPMIQQKSLISTQKISHIDNDIINNLSKLKPAKKALFIKLLEELA
jgi:hypothetical protein